MVVTSITLAANAPELTVSVCMSLRTASAWVIASCRQMWSHGCTFTEGVGCLERGDSLPLPEPMAAPRGTAAQVECVLRHVAVCYPEMAASTLAMRASSDVAMNRRPKP